MKLKSSNTWACKSQYHPILLSSLNLDFSSNTTTLSQITPKTAMYYTFHTTASTPPPFTLSASVLLGPAQALNELLERGCSLATKPWVDNHWSLILWKLAGMVGLDPEKETKPDETKWCWPEVIRQLLYR